MKQVAILIVLYNNEQNLISLFNSMGKQKYKDISIYILDNNSSDNSVKLTKNLWPSANIIQLSSNLGFATGNNILARKAIDDGAEYLFILNPDMELHPNCVEELVKLAENKIDIGVAAPVVFYSTEDNYKNKIQEYGAFVDFILYKIDKNFSGQIYEEVEDKIPEFMYVDCVAGCATFLKSKVYEKIGLWEEKYFMYGDEIDFSKRVIDSGYKLMVTKKAKAWHNHDWSRNSIKRYYIEYYFIPRSKYLYFKKFGLTKSKCLSLMRDLILFPITLLWFKKVCNLRLGYYYLKGIIDGLRGKSGKPEMDFK